MIKAAHRVAIYLRVSTLDQTTANQERELREVASRMGCEVVKVYRDHRVRSRVRPSIIRRVLIDHTCFGRSGGFAPISLPLFQGVRVGLFNRQASLSDMVVLLGY